MTAANETFKAKEAAEVIKALEDKRKRIKKSGKPIPADKIYLIHGSKSDFFRRAIIHYASIESDELEKLLKKKD